MDKQDNTENIISNHSSIQNPLIFGEVLFDQFEDGSSVLGGAPFNVAWNLQGFGVHPVFLTKVGDDKNGETILEKMNNWGLQNQGVQHDSKHPTGKVTIKLDQGQPTYNIIPDQAYDNIDNISDTTITNMQSCPLLYHGSLALRNSVSRNSLFKLLNKYSPPTFVDINLRDPWWNKEVIQQSLNHANWAKFNDVELIEIATLTNIKFTDIKDTAILLRKHFNLKLLIITLGADGAFFISENNSYFGLPVAANNISDTVGAGDAFSSVTILGLLKKWPIEKISQRAMTFASAVCEIRGATTSDPDFYKNMLISWGK